MGKLIENSEFWRKKMGMRRGKERKERKGGRYDCKI